MLVLIEGADRQGKTVLAEYLARDLGWQYVHHGPPTGGADSYIDELLTLNRPTVMDRSFLGELVYGPLLRGRSCLTKHQFSVLCLLARRLNAVVIHCHQHEKPGPSWSTLDEKGLSLGITEAVNTQAKLDFLAVIQEATRYLPFYRYSCNTLADMIIFTEQIKPVLLQNTDNLAVNLELLTGLGSSSPDVILVGERVNPRVTWRNLPFDAGGSAAYLLERLEESQLPRAFYLLNAQQHNGDPTNFAELKNLLIIRKVPVIALGNQAASWLTAGKFNFVKVPHPQYQKRFKAAESWEYSKMLWEAYHAQLD